MNNSTYPLSLSQKDIYFDQLHRLKNPMYNIGGYMTLASVDIARLQRAHKQLVTSFAAFGVRIHQSEEGVFQSISSQRTTELPIIDFSQAVDPTQACDEWLKARFEQPFSIHEGELFSAYLLKLSEQTYRYIGLAHHLIMDGWGFANWTGDLCRFYNQQPPEGNDVWLENLAQEEEYINSTKYQKDAEFWRQQCSSLNDKLFTAFYRGEYDKKVVPSGRAVVPLARSQYQQLKQFCQANGVGAPQVFLASTCAYFSQTYHTQSLMVGIPSHNRKRHADKRSLGLFVGVNPLNISLPDARLSIVELAKSIAKQQKQSYRHQQFPLGHAIAQIEGLTDKSELYEVGFNYLKLDSELNFDGHESKLVYLSNNHETTPLLLTVWEYGDSESIEFQLDYSKAYFTETEARLIGERIQFCVQQLLAQQDITLAELSLIPPQEIQQLNQFCHGQVLAVEEPMTLNGLFQRQLTKTPDAIAVSDEQQQLSYRQLDEQAKALASVLQAQGCNAGDSIGICVTRSAEMVIAMLAVLQCGGSYIPLDPNYPHSRLSYLLADSQATGVICDGNTAQLAASLTKLPLINVQDERYSDKTFTPIEVDAEEVAYYIYTSGSTGQPKGVEIRQRNAYALVNWAMKQFSVEELSTVLASTSLNFDLSVFEIFAPLAVGGQVVVVKDALSLIENPKPVSLINTVPSAIKALLEVNAIPNTARVINLAGEPLSQHVVNDLIALNSVEKVYNLYGPSEDTTYSTYRCFEQAVYSAPSIGHPIANTQAWVVSKEGKQQPIGVAGELYLSGDGVAKQYCNLPQLSAEKFITNSSFCQSVLYKTGDLVRFDEFGELHFLGRLDHQVKIRGFRVELGEIETQLLKHSKVKEAIVMLQGEASQELCAFVVAEPKSKLEQAELKQLLALSLPEYMVPQCFIFIEAMPLSPNGKIDRKALLSLQPALESETVTAPKGHIECELAELWSALLGKKAIGRESEFFALGGHSLLVVRLLGLVHQHFNAAVMLPDLFEFTSLQAMAECIKQAPRLVEKQVSKVEGDKALPLSKAQLGIWLDVNTSESTARYNMPLLLKLPSHFEPEALKHALNGLVHQHQILASRFSEGSEGVKQVYDPEVVIELPVLEVKDDSQLQAQFEKLIAQPFDLKRDSLVRALLLQKGKAHYLCLVIHHIVCDGWSMGLLAKDLGRQYQQVIESSECLPSPAGAIQFRDYIAAQQESDEARQEAEIFWQQKLHGCPQLHGLPLDFERTTQRAELGKSEQFSLTGKEYTSLQRIAAELHITPAVLLQACFTFVLSRWSNSTDIMLGVPTLGRRELTAQPLVGCFTELQVVRSLIDDRLSLAELASQTQQLQRDSMVHMELPFHDLVERFATTRNVGSSPLVQILFNYQEVGELAFTIADELCERVIPDSVNIRFEFELHVEHHSEHYRCELIYADSLFSATTIQRFIDSFQYVIERLRQTIHHPLSKLKLAPDTHLKQQLVAYQSEHSSLNAMLEHSIDKFSERIALEARDRVLTYRQLGEAVEQLAVQLVGLGVKPNDTVGLCLTRESHLVIAVLAVIKVGANYTSLDPDYPKTRLGYIVADSCIAHVITESSLLQVLDGASGATLHDIQVLLNRKGSVEISWPTLTDDMLSHVIYTSGSTGQPKGVEISHRSVLALVDWAKGYFNSEQLRAVLASTSLNFDLSVFEIFAPLSVGGKIVLVKNALALTEEHYDVSLINTVPSAAKVLIEQAAIPKTVTTVNLAGEALPMPVVNELLSLEQVKVVNNLYGPSEDTTYSTAAKFTSAVTAQPSIGQAIDYTLAAVVSESGVVQPDGAIGELYLAGAGLAKQYRGKPELTAEKFVTSPELDGVRFYRTGDLVRVDADNHLIYLGRSDHQIKLRGFRVELGEIEARITELNSVQEAAVILSESTSPAELIAYVVSGKKNLDMAELKAALQERLPTYMVPSLFIQLEQMPLTPNGKLDRKALPAPNVEQTPGELPATEVEKKIAALWQQLLHRSVMYRHDNFFDLGGHSLLVARFVHLAQQQYGFSIPAHWLYRHQTLATLADVVYKQCQQSQPLQTKQLKVAPLSSSQYRIWFLQRIQGDNAQHNISGALKITGVVKYADIQKALRLLVERHDMLRTKVVNSGDYPSQELCTLQELPLSYIDFTAEKHLDIRLSEVVREHQKQPINIEAPGLWSMLCVKTASDEVLLHFNFHHIIADGWSLSLLLSELIALLNGEALAEFDAGWGYLDYAHWQQNKAPEDIAQGDANFWTGYLAGGNEGVSLPFDAPSSSVAAEQPEIRITLSRDLTVQLESLARANGGQLFDVLYNAFGLLVARLTGAHDFNIGIPVTGRERAEIQNLFGNFLNNLPTRFNVQQDDSLQQLLTRQTASLKQVLAHQSMPFEQILALAKSNDGNGNKTGLFQLFFNMMNLPEVLLDGECVKGEILLDEYVDNNFDLTLYALKAEQQTTLRFNFDSDKFARASVEVFANQYISLLEQFCIESAAQSVDSFALDQCSEEVDVRAQVKLFKALPWEIAVHDKVARQAQLTPDNLAICHLERCWSYREIDNITAQLASLFKQRGVEHGDRVALVTQRSDLLVFATLATLRSGAAFVMLSSNWPQQRAQDIIEAAQPSLFVTFESSGLQFLKQLDETVSSPIVNVDVPLCQQLKENPEREQFVQVAPDDVAYIAFTSGTEGKPKGVQGRHRTLTTFSDWMVEQFELKVTDRFGMLSGLVHDPLHRDMFTPLMMGASLYIPSEQQYQYDNLSQWLSEQQVSVLHMTPSLGYMIATTTQTDLPYLRRCFFVGEKLTKAHVSDFKRFASNLSIINMYGSTETGRAIGYYYIPSEQSIADLPDVLPAGVGIAGTQLLVLKPDLSLCAVGEPGQIAVRSNALALGYLNDPDKTNEKFIYLNNSCDLADRIYLTGDMGRYRPDGNVLCLGRNDRQVKIRGFRVELAEIEVAASKLDSVRQAVVLADEAPSGCRILLYVVATQIESDDLRLTIEAELAQLLPDYMRPSCTTVIAEIPQTENGKIDSNALLAQTAESVSPELHSPTSELEEAVWKICCDALATDQVCTRVSFFKQGGNSLLMTQVLARIQRELHVSISYEDFFNDSSVENVASMIAHKRAMKHVLSGKQNKKNKKKVLL